MGILKNQILLWIQEVNLPRWNHTSEKNTLEGNLDSVKFSFTEEGESLMNILFFIYNIV
jgi:hypothetical protein